jgi:hypothetical protein
MVPALNVVPPVWAKSPLRVTVPLPVLMKFPAPDESEMSSKLEVFLATLRVVAPRRFIVSKESVAFVVFVAVPTEINLFAAKLWEPEPSASRE